MESKLTKTKAGFVAIVGRSNVGKSTLLNALIETKVAIVTPKPQTTRGIIQGILSEERGQVIFLDTPGLYQETHNSLTHTLNRLIPAALNGADLVIHLVDPTRALGNEEREIFRMLASLPREKKILVLNKTDAPKRRFEHEYLRYADGYQESLSISAKLGAGLKELKRACFDALPLGAPYFPIGQLTTLSSRESIGEIIREKVFERMYDEVPYLTQVEVRDFYEDPSGLIIIGAAIITAETRHRKMLIGTGGRMIKAIGSAARKELEGVFGKKVYLGLEVEVKKNWQKIRRH